MKKIYPPRSFCCLAVAIGYLLLLNADVSAQSEEEIKTTSELKEEVLTRGEAPHPLIGMEAFQEVLASGTYLVGPGDEFLIMATGMKNPLEIPVLPEGGLFIPLVGKVQVGGLVKLEAAKGFRDGK